MEIIPEDKSEALTEQSKADILCARRVCEQTLDMIQKARKARNAHRM